MDEATEVVEMENEQPISALLEADADVDTDKIGNKNFAEPRVFVFEGELDEIYRGVTKCGRESKTRKIAGLLAERFRNAKQQQYPQLSTKDYGWRKLRASTRRWQDPFPSNARHCSTHVYVICYVVMQER